ncbi:MAG: hypothetical protein DRQ62_03200 [Gammaproteobacteria bacterium]|nr:MAG: hypothetical protein DRQ62_03200 [Gammaproteobacteria bacterium]
MNNSTHFFDPELEGLYTLKLTANARTWTDNSAELWQLFDQLNQAGQKHQVMSRAYAFIKHELRQVEQNHAAKIKTDYSSDKLASLQVLDPPLLAKQYWTKENLSLCIKQTAAVYLTQPCWLQNISTSASSQTKTSLQLMSLYLHLTGKDQHNMVLQDTYHALLLATGSKIPSLHMPGFSEQADLAPEVLGFATLQLGLALFPRVLLPEILGFTLAYCQMPTIIETCFPKSHLPELYFQQRQQRLKQQIIPLIECITAYLDLFPQHTQSLWLRIQKGFWLYQQQVQRNNQQFKNSLDSAQPSQQHIAKLLLQKSVATIGHHRKIQLQGKSLDQWFAELPENTQEFLQALIQSDYVDRQTPANSQLLKLFAFKGPMFGVLDKSELDILLSWLQDELKITPTNVGAVFSREGLASPSRLKTAPTVEINKLALKQKADYAKLSTRELYYYLLNVDLFPDILPAAKSKADKLLRRCALFNPLPFKHYSHQRFDAYIENIYQQEISTYQPLQGAPKISKEAYIWGFEQIAPMILIDGCWIQNSQALQQLNPEICDILCKIYCDEIGGGLLIQNHPYIFQQLLKSLSIQLPPAYSKDFIEHPGFINSAFDLPTYMLSVSSFSVEFLPELLGLNMAIELSGLGKSYMRLVDDWNYWGIDPSIASIHISIDNYASGHTFLAKKAIHLYMDAIMQVANDRTILDRHWRRIYTGYASLRFVGGRFKFGLPIEYLVYKFKHKYGFANINNTVSTLSNAHD